jgi:hypothetical protein
MSIRVRKLSAKEKIEANARGRKWSRNNPRTVRNLSLRKLYGITIDDYEHMYRTQDGKCAICFERFEKLDVDHNHQTTKVRALLCKSCNLALGLMKDNTLRLRSAATYLERYGET